MAVQEIGVKAIFDTSQFNSGLQEYIDGMARATAAARAFAGDANIPIPAPRIDDGDLGGRVRRTSGLLDNLKKLLSGDISGATGIASTAFSGLATVIGGALVAGVGAAIAGLAGLGVALKASVSTAADFEQQVANIAAVSGQGIEGVSALRDLALDLSIDPNLTVSAGGAGEAIEMLLKNGVAAEDVLNGLARSTVALSNATGSDFATAADVATDAMNIFGISAEDFEQVADSITGVMVNSKFGINDMALAMAQGGSVASSAGVSFEDFSTIMTAVSSNFASGSDAGTSFKTFMQRLQAPTDAAQEALDAFGVSLYDSNGNVRDIMDVMKDFASIQDVSVTTTEKISKLNEAEQASYKRLEGQLKSNTNAQLDYMNGIAGIEMTEEERASKLAMLKKQEDAIIQSLMAYGDVSEELISTTRNLTDQEKQNNLVKIFGADAIRFATSLMKLEGEELDALGDKVNKSGQAQQAAATRTQTFQGAMERLSSQFEYLKILVGTPFLSVFSDTLDKNIVPKIKLVQEAFDGLTLENMGDRFLRLAERMTKAVAIDIGEMFGLSPESMQGIFKQINTVRDTINSLMGSFSTGGIGAVRINIAEMLGLDTTIVEQLNEIESTIKGAISKLFSGIFSGDIGGGYKAATLDIMQMLGFHEGTISIVSQFQDKIIAAVSGIFTSLANFDLAGIAESLGLEKVAASLPALSEAFTKLGQSAPWLQIFAGSFSGLAQAFMVMDIGLMMTIGNALSTIADLFLGISVDAITGFVNAFAGLNSMIVGLASADMEKATSGLADFAGALVQVMASPIENIVSSFETSFEGMAQQMGNMFAETIKNALGFAAPSTEAAQELGSSVASWFGWGVEESAEPKSATVSATGEAIDEGVATGEGATAIGKAIADGAKQGIEDGRAGVISSSREMARAAIDAAKAELGIASPSKVFAGIGGFMAQGMVEGMNSGMASVGRASVAMAQYATAQATPNYSVNNSRVNNFYLNYASQQPSQSVRQDVLLLRAMHA